MTLPEARRVFADLMQQARGGTLTEHARRRLAQARQLLRRARRPAMNPTGKRQFVITKVKQGRSLYWSATGFHPDVKYAEKFHNKDEAQRWIDQHAAYDAGYRDAFPEPIGKLTRPQFSNPARFPHGRHLVELKKIRMGGIPFAFVVVRDGQEIGFITKYRDTRTETHPWKAYVGIGEHSTYLGAVYGSDGKAKAVKAIVDGIPLENRLTRTKARRILHEGKVRGRRLTPRQRRYFGARASGAPRRNPGRKMQRIGRAVEVRYRRDIGRQPGYYKHEIQSRKAGVYTIPPGWVYVSTKSILITEREPRVSR